MALITVEGDGESIKQAQLQMMKISLMLSLASLVLTYALHKNWV